MGQFLGGNSIGFFGAAFYKSLPQDKSKKGDNTC
jgi:hypothetical protein